MAAARERSLSDLRADAYKRSDNEGAEDRHPPADVDRYINQGGAELRDLLIEARGRAYFKADPPFEIVTIAETTRYDLPEGFYRLLGVRKGGTGSYALEALRPNAEAALRDPSAAGQFPTHYELTGDAIELLPEHAAGTTIVVDYVPAYVDLVADDDKLEGYSGWEEYPVCFAARCMAIKDDEPRLIATLEREMARLRERIMKLAPTRDSFRAERVRNVRGARIMRGG